MRIIITEKQLASLIEDNDYFNYDNISNADKELFYKTNAGYNQNKLLNKDKGKFLYIKVMKWTGGDLTDSENFKSEYKRFTSIPLAKSWYQKQTYNKKYFKLIYVYGQ